MKHAVEELSVLNQIASAINVSMSIDKITRIIVDRCLKRVNAAQGAIFLLDDEPTGDARFTTFIRQMDPGSEQVPYRLNISLTGWMIKHKQILLTNDPQRDDRFSGLDFAKLGIHSILAVPLLSRSGLIGVLVLFNKNDDGGFSDSDKRFTGIVATQTAKVIENARLFEREQRLKAIEEELRVAREIQKGFLPSENVVRESCEIAGFNHPATDMGGDYYDIIDIGHECYFMSIGDVSGKGIPAALLMANAQAVLRSQLRGVNETMLSSMARALNHLICQFASPMQFITAIFGIFNTSSRSFHYINAGHNAPIVVHPDGKLTPVNGSNMVLGVLPDVNYELRQIQLACNDTFFLYTDGVTDQKNTDDAQFLDDRLQALLTEYCSVSAAELGSHILTALRVFRQQAAQTDDITMLIAKCRERV
ncbi:MAG: SpoIIE family protein phosphatase [candidate division Zixibacteria bacterium]|nr:SpoIIE family protein phosphatase [candidate division Zixibacteria bacterium]